MEHDKVLIIATLVIITIYNYPINMLHTLNIYNTMLRHIHFNKKLTPQIWNNQDHLKHTLLLTMNIHTKGIKTYVQ